MTLTSQQIEALKKITSPSVANAIETFNVRPRNQGNMSSEIRTLFPEMGPLVGHAVTAVIRAAAQGENLSQGALRRAAKDLNITFRKLHNRIVGQTHRPTYRASVPPKENLYGGP